MAYGYIHEKYIIDFKVPAVIQELMSTLEQMDKEEDYRYYTNEDMLDITCKSCCAAGQLTTSQWEVLVRRYWSGD